MTIFSARTLGFALAGALSVSVMTPVGAGGAHAQAMITLEQAVKDCRLIGEKSVRLSCYDRAIDASNAPPPRQSYVPAPPAPVASVAPPAPPAPASVAARPAPPPPAPAPVASVAAPAPASVAQATQSAPKPDTPDGVVVQIASAGLNGNQILSVTAATGEIWVQTDNAEFAHLPKPGDEMLVTKNVFGKRTCHVGTTAFSCTLKK